MATRPSGFANDAGSQFLTDSFQRGLAHWNRERLEPGFPSDDWSRIFERDIKMQRLEGGFLEELRAEVADEAAAAPTDVEGFIAWFVRLAVEGKEIHVFGDGSQVRDFVYVDDAVDAFLRAGIPAGGLFSGEYARSAFVAEPVHNLVHRDVLEPSGARRAGCSKSHVASFSSSPPEEAVHRTNGVAITAVSVVPWRELAAAPRRAVSKNPSFVSFRIRRMRGSRASPLPSASPYAPSAVFDAQLASLTSKPPSISSIVPAPRREGDTVTSVGVIEALAVSERPAPFTTQETEEES